jgi:superfamily I DNA/RNA helicase
MHGDPLLAGLNAAQREAATCTEGPLLVLAGAGTGKTRVITHRIAHLLRRGVPAEAILAVTFTNKAAREMRERVASIVGSTPRGITLSTFHSLGVRILRAEAASIGYRHDFGICDEADQVSLLRTIVRDLRGAVAAVDARAVLAHISRAKNRFELPAEALEAASDDWEHLVACAYERYQSSLRDLNNVDFDDLILLPVLCLRHEEIARKYRLRFRYILVDEYQDTNGAQYHFLRALVGPHRNLCVVGDDDQSIYGFRGADRDKILGFERDFPGARVVKLEENYRSTGAILDLANAVIASNLARHGKVLRSTVGQGAPVVKITTSDELAEVDCVVRRISSLIEAERVPPTSIAILIRAAIQARPFEEKLRLRQIPYTLVGGQSYFDRKEIRDVLAYFRAASNPRDDLSLLRILNVPRRGFGSTTIQKLDALARQSGLSLLEALGQVAGGAGDFSSSLRAAAGHVHDLFLRARERLEQGQISAMAHGLVEESSYREAVEDLYADPVTRQGRWGAVTDLLASVDRWAASQPGAALTDFLEAVALDGDERGDEPKSARGVMIMTLHSAKGLEFPHVFLVGVEEDLLPHKRAAAEGDAAIEEERRLFYVGITRARACLTLTHASVRTAFGEPQPRLPSRFLGEVAGRGLLEEHTYNGQTEASEDDIQQYVQDYRRLRRK